jgi:23S rRNA pseudouridine1911/1915/1917 synthase
MEASQLEVLYEDNHLIAINKPAGMLVQPDTTGDKALEDLVKEYIGVKYEKPGEVFLGVTHRIDRPVSGVVLFAKTSKALTRINEMFKVNKIKKSYWAIVKNRPEKEKATLTHYIFRDTKRNVSRASEKEIPNSKQATLSYSIIGQSDNYTLLEIDLKTGRHHQIRCQLAKIGCPIKGDLKYGFPRSNPDAGISLHSRQMVFEHPVKKEMITIIAPTPKDNLWDSFVKAI